ILTRFATYCCRQKRKLSHSVDPRIHSAASPIITNTATGAPTPTNTASSFPPLDNQTQSTSPLSSFYAQGVIHQFGILSLVSPSTSLATSPNPVQEISTRIGTGTTTTNCKEKLTVLFLVMVWIILLTYRILFTAMMLAAACQILRLRGLGNNGSSGDDEKAEPWMTSPSSPMKNLPAQACPVSLRDARSLVTSGSDSNSVIMVFHHLHQVLHALLLHG
ncbi:hypothetical protein Gotri_009222, partial [Gossypium trilobum]|nr:hypothetical protein [Gossypium trilobum]